MKDDIFSVFAKIHAEDALKEKTRNYLYKEIQKKRRVMKGRSGLVVACSVLAGLFLAVQVFIPFTLLQVLILMLISIHP